MPDTPEKYSKAWFLSRPCLPGCGGCCPKSCEHLTIELKCAVHPLALGVSEQEAEKKGRHWACHFSPWVLFTYIHDCPAITDVLRNDFGIEVKSHVNRGGQGVIDNLDELMIQIKEIWRGH